MGIALLRKFGRRKVEEAGLAEKATASLNMRMQRMLDLHTQAGIKPQALPPQATNQMPGPPFRASQQIKPALAATGQRQKA